MIILPVSKIVITCSSSLFLEMNVEIEISVSVPIKVKPNSFNSNLTPVKIALGFLLGSSEYTPSTSVYISHLSDFKKAAKAIAVVSEPPLP